MYFQSDNAHDPNEQLPVNQLIEDHKKRFAKKLKKDKHAIPKIFIKYATNLFEEHLKDMVDSTNKALTSDRDVQELVDEWTEFSK